MRLPVLVATLLVCGCGPGSGPTSTPTATATPSANPPEAREQLRDCKTNLKNYATAYEMYSADFQGRYPASPSKLTPNYLKVLPTCPTNDSAYRVESTGATPPDGYTFYCQGGHGDLTPEYPRYTSVQGLIERP